MEKNTGKKVVTQEKLGENTGNFISAGMWSPCAWNAMVQITFWKEVWSAVNWKCPQRYAKYSFDYWFTIEMVIHSRTETSFGNCQWLQPTYERFPIERLAVCNWIGQNQSGSSGHIYSPEEDQIHQVSDSESTEISWSNLEGFEYSSIESPWNQKADAHSFWRVREG